MLLTILLSLLLAPAHFIVGPRSESSPMRTHELAVDQLPSTYG